jgi:hypothetical protein
MHSETSPEHADADLRRRIAALFERFATGEGGRSNSADAAHLLDQLRASPGARILCCDRSVTAFGWALTAAGCSIASLSREEGPEPWDGAVCSPVALAAGAAGSAPSTVALLSDGLRTEARLVVTGASDPAGGSTLLPSTSFNLLGQPVSPGGRRLSVWVRIGRGGE